MDYVKEMDRLLQEDVKNGMTGIRFFVESETGATDFAHDFCVIEHAIRDGHAKVSYELCS